KSLQGAHVVSRSWGSKRGAATSDEGRTSAARQAASRAGRRIGDLSGGGGGTRESTGERWWPLSRTSSPARLPRRRARCGGCRPGVRALSQDAERERHVRERAVDARNVAGVMGAGESGREREIDAARRPPARDAGHVVRHLGRARERRDIG